MKRKLRISENKIRKAIKEALEDFGFDSENGEFNEYDTPQEQYRVVYDLATKLDRTHWQTVEDGIKKFQTEQEAYDFIEELRQSVSNFYGYGVWAAKLKIERQMDTLTGESWDTVKDFSDTWLDGHDMRESKLRNMIKESVIQILKEELGDPVQSDGQDYEGHWDSTEEEDAFYSEEDINGNTGSPGMIKSYDIGYWTVDQLEQDAAENNMSPEDFLKLWWENVGNNEIPFQWTEQRSGYGFNGDTLLDLNNVKFKDIHGQIMIDEYPPLY